MAASLWSKAFGHGLVSPARVCRASQHALAVHALRAGRISSVRQGSAQAALANAEESTLASPPTPTPTSTPTPTRGKKQEQLSNSDQPKFETLQDAVSVRTLKALTGDPFRLVHMSPVQARVLPLLPGLVQPPASDGEHKGSRDLMVKARTGTGKTLAFLVPAVEARLNALRKVAEEVAQSSATNSKLVITRGVEKYARTKVGTLIISPTRELATQIANEAIKLTKHHDKFEIRIFVGGLPQRKQLREWNVGRRDIVVATPGRLRDFIENEPGFKEDLGTAEMLILDEADTLLEMGFREDIEAITKHLKPPPERQTFMFSATMSRAIQQVARRTLAEEHTFLNCVPHDAPPTHMQIPQFYTGCPTPDDQIPHIVRLIAEDQLLNPGSSKVLVFLPTTRLVQLYSTIIPVIGKEVLPAGPRTRFAEMHAKKAMSSRINTSDWFRRDTSGATVMFTSDVSARGVDYPGVTRVIQVGIPPNGDSYVHRVGRTGRGKNMKGRADLVLQPWEVGFLSWQLTDIPIKELTTNQLKEQVAALAQQYEENPEAFASEGHQRFQYAPDVAARLENISQQIEVAQRILDKETVNEAMSSVLSFYASNSDNLRVQRGVTNVGVHAWAKALLGEEVQLRLPREHMDFRRRESNSYKRHQKQPADRWMKRGRVRQDSDKDEDRNFDFDADISGGGDRRGDRKDSGARRGWHSNREQRSYGFGERRSRDGNFDGGDRDSRPRWSDKRRSRDDGDRY